MGEETLRFSRRVSSLLFSGSYNDFTPFRSALPFSALHSIRVETPPRFSIANAVPMKNRDNGDERWNCAGCISPLILLLVCCPHAAIPPQPPGFRWGVGVNKQTLRNRVVSGIQHLKCTISPLEGWFQWSFSCCLRNSGAVSKTPDEE